MEKKGLASFALAPSAPKSAPLEPEPPRWRTPRDPTVTETPASAIMVARRNDPRGRTSRRVLLGESALRTLDTKAFWSTVWSGQSLTSPGRAHVRPPSSSGQRSGSLARSLTCVHKADAGQAPQSENALALRDGSVTSRPCGLLPDTRSSQKRTKCSSLPSKYRALFLEPLREVPGETVLNVGFKRYLASGVYVSFTYPVVPTQTNASLKRLKKEQPLPRELDKIRNLYKFPLLVNTSLSCRKHSTHKTRNSHSRSQ